MRRRITPKSARPARLLVRAKSGSWTRLPPGRQTRSDVRTPQGGCSRSIPGSLLDLRSDFRFDLAVSHRLSRSHNEQHRGRAHRVVRRAATALVVRLGFVAEEGYATGAGVAPADGDEHEFWTGWRG